MKTSLRFYGPGALGQFFFIGLLVLMGLSGFGQKVFYVTPSGGGTPQDGSSWGNAFAGTQLQAAIEAASAYSQAHENQDVQVWVAAGTYKPTEDGNRDISFSMRNHVAIYGGFVGTETALSQRPSVLSTPSSTTLSGDIGEPGVTSDNSRILIDNASYFIGSLLYLDNSAVIDGFIITGAYSTETIGGKGMHNQAKGEGSYCDPVVRNCWFIDNTGWHGAAVMNEASSPASANPVFINCSFVNNRATQSGGAMFNFTAYFGTVNPQVINCRFVNNHASDGSKGDGGAIGILALEGGNINLQLTNCTFINNWAQNSGAAIYGSSAGSLGETNDSAVLTNCIFWKNGNGGENTFGIGDIEAHYCLFDIPVPGSVDDHNLTTDRFPFVSETDLRLTACSPAIDAGDPASSGTTDLAGNPRFYNNGRIDIGAYEFQGRPLAAPSLSLPPAVTRPILQNTPSVGLTVSGCEGGTVAWRSSTGVTGTGTSIPVPTDAVTTLIYSATCTVGDCTSPPGSTTVVINPPSMTGSFDGFIYGADCSTFRGWAWDRNKPNTAVPVEILDGPVVIDTLMADVFRSDLQTAGKGNGKHAFFFSIPPTLKDGLPHHLSARVAGSSFLLKDSPKALICQVNPTGPTANKAPAPPSPTVLIAPLVAQVGVPFAGTLVAFTDPEGDALSYQLTGLPDGLKLEAGSRVIQGTPLVAGSFVLTYQATDTQGATNSVSFNLTVNPAAGSPVTGDFEGYLDKLDCGGIRGWVWDRKKPNTPLTVEFFTQVGTGPATVWGSTVANIVRPDLIDAKKGNGAHAYNFTAPSGLVNGTLVRARVLGSPYELKGSPRAYQCSKARLSAERGAELQVAVLGNPVTDYIQVEIRGTEGQPLRLQVLDGNGRSLQEQTIPAAKAVEHQKLWVQQQPAGLFLLRVTQGGQAIVVKLLKSY
ncbi:putative Ig domain-containing protein [Larkinella bovis]|uniref:Ig domain-containing protein n=1 Tax=Larkinella bovis TaxID=683041 RepID=A0ABW0I7H4_9BACT